MNRRYILDGKTPVECEDLLQWASWMEMADTVVARTEHDEIVVSTVFLGLDYQHGDGPPLLFETMVFGGSHNEKMRRYTTWEEAEEGHRQTCEEVFRGITI